VSTLRYRADIDGLRSVAVLPVMLFHFGVAAIPGGFIGVDVFFVISGYLIASIIAREINEGHFSILRFYERSAYDKPLLHTWSLAIEEQFYLFVPLILMAVAWRGKNVWRRMGLWVTGLTALSFLLSAFATAAFPTAAYYLIPWRAWELGIGAMLALDVVPRLKSDLQRHVAGLAGITLIICAALAINKSMTFPGVVALAPVLGTALIIQAGRDGPNLIGRLLGAPLPVLIGKLSYSLYLWHWPLVRNHAARQ